MSLFEQHGKGARPQRPRMPTQTTETDDIRVKIVYNGEVQITYITAGISVDKLREEMRAICNFDATGPSSDQFTMKWVDDEGDPCRIASQQELDEALRLYELEKDTEITIHARIFEIKNPGSADTPLTCAKNSARAPVSSVFSGQLSTKKKKKKPAGRRKAFFAAGLLRRRRIGKIRVYIARRAELIAGEALGKRKKGPLAHPMVLPAPLLYTLFTVCILAEKYIDVVRAALRFLFSIGRAFGFGAFFAFCAERTRSFVRAALRLGYH